MDRGLASGLLVLEAMSAGLLEAADVALHSSGEAGVIGGEAQDRCGIAGTLWTEPLAHVAALSPAVAAG
jgi:hypothetical protein